MASRRLLVVAAALVACLGIALTLYYVRGADDRAAEKYDTINILTATQPISAGESLEQAVVAGKVELTPVVNNQVLGGYQTSTDQLSGLVATTAIYPGEQIIAAKFGSTVAPVSTLPIPEGLVASTINLTDAGRVAGFVAPGSQVGVYFNWTDPETGKPASRLLIPKVSVLGVGSTATVTSGQVENQTVSNTLLTLAVTQAEAEKLIFAQQNGSLSVVLLSESSAINALASQRDYTNLFN